MRLETERPGLNRCDEDEGSFESSIAMKTMPNSMMMMMTMKNHVASLIHSFRSSLFELVRFVPG